VKDKVREGFMKSVVNRRKSVKRMRRIYKENVR